MSTGWDPDWVVAPGETLADWFNELHLPHSIAAHYGISERMLERILDGRQTISPALAQKLDGMTNIDARMWLALEHNFRVGLAAGKTWAR